ncbi:UNVERIFIED_CONTAM: retroviral-like aspartic protease, partial [Salmonella enterica subsp. enterica serovar Weltevreden]
DRLEYPKYLKFLNSFKNLQVNIHFVEALIDKPSYAKFFKYALSIKKEFDEFETICLGEECSTMLQNRMLPKMNDPGSFSIPCMIEGLEFNDVLCDLGSAVNVMSYNVYKALRDCPRMSANPCKDTRLTLHLADKTVRYPRGIVEGVLVDTGKFVFECDFVVLDFAEKDDATLILGRPFLTTSRALIDCDSGTLTLRMLGEKSVFVRKRKQPEEVVDSCCVVTVLQDAGGMPKKKKKTPARQWVKKSRACGK